VRGQVSISERMKKSQSKEW